MTGVATTCPSCNGLVEAGDRFCQDCGLQLGSSLSSPLLGNRAPAPSKAANGQSPLKSIPGKPPAKPQVKPQSMTQSKLPSKSQTGSRTDLPYFVKPAVPDQTNTSRARLSKTGGKSTAAPTAQMFGSWRLPDTPEWLLFIAMLGYVVGAVQYVAHKYPELLVLQRQPINFQMWKPAQPAETHSALAAPPVSARSSKTKSSRSSISHITETASPSVAAPVGAKSAGGTSAGGTSAAGATAAGATAAGATAAATPIKSVEAASTEPSGRKKSGLLSTSGFSEVKTDGTASGITAPEKTVDTATAKLTEKAAPVKAKPPTRQQIRDLATYNKLLARYFSKQSKETSAPPPESTDGSQSPELLQGADAGAAVAPKSAEPPSFQEWLDSNKADF